MVLFFLFGKKVQRGIWVNLSIVAQCCDAVLWGILNIRTTIVLMNFYIEILELGFGNKNELNWSSLPVNMGNIHYFQKEELQGL